MDQSTIAKKLERLTVREREVLVSLANGKTNKELARKLGISPRTVQKHLQRIYAKLGVGGRTGGAVVAVRVAMETKGQAAERHAPQDKR